ncbi:MAG: ABC transporter permease [Alphaproteobacteria bacterium]|nr:ABC transporter permease [Alphaproteobacteria bacterium]
MIAALGRIPVYWLLIAPVLVFYAIFLIGPYLAVFAMSFWKFSSSNLFIVAFTGENYAAALTDPFYLRLLARTIWLGLVVTFVTLLMGYPLTLCIVRASPAMKSFLLIVALSPLLINLVVRSYAWLVLLGDRGVINAWLMASGMITAPLPINTNFFAVTVGLVHVTLPLMVLSLVGIMERIDSSLLEAAESLGAGPWRTLFRVHVHLALPGIATGSLLVFCTAISAFVTPRLLGGNRFSTVSTAIYEKFSFSMNWPLGAALVFVLLAANFLVMALHSRMFPED